MNRQAPALVIGYGNALRGDDAVGAYVAEHIAKLSLPGVRAVAIHQLTPELAEPIAQATVVIFVDAVETAGGREQTRIIDLQADDSKPSDREWGHRADPSMLLDLAKRLYDSCPVAFWLLIPACSFRLGEPLSRVARSGAEEAIDWIAATLARTECIHA